MRSVIYYLCIAQFLPTVLADSMVWAEPESGVPEGRLGHSATRVGNKMFVLGGGMKSKRVLLDLHVLDFGTMSWSNPKASGSVPSKMQGHCAELVDGKLFVFGGTDGENFNNDLYTLDTESMRWETVTPKGFVPKPRAHHSCSVIDGKIFVYGGYDGVGYKKDVHILDTGSLEWTSPVVAGDAPQGRSYHTATVVGSKIYIVGGFGSGVYFDDVNVLDAGSMSWTVPRTSGSMPATSHHSASLLGTDLILFGGIVCDTTDKQNQTCTASNEVRVLDTVYGKWSTPATKGRAPRARSGHTAILQGSTVYIWAGFAEVFYLNDMFMLDAYAMAWGIARGSPPPHMFQMCSVFDEEQNKAIVWGGRKGQEEFTNGIHELSMETQEWKHPKQGGFLPSPRAGHSCNLVPGNKMVMFGGYDGTTYTNDIALFDTADYTWSWPTPPGPGPVGRMGHTATLLGDKIYFYGGMRCQSAKKCEMLSDMTVLTVSTMSWKQPQVSGVLPYPRESHTTVPFEDHLYVYGGTSDQQQSLDDLFKYNVETGVWSRVLPKGIPPGPRTSHSSVIIKHYMYSFGGGSCSPSGGCKYFNEVQRLNLQTQKWLKLNLGGALVPAQRYGHAAQAVGSVMWMFGGAAWPNMFNDMLFMGFVPTAPKKCVLQEAPFMAAKASGAIISNATRPVGTMRSPINGSTVDAPAKLTLQSVDELAFNRTSGGDKFTMQMFGADTVTDGLTVQGNITDLQSGKYLVFHQGTVSGLYQMEILLNSKLVAGGPFLIKVYPGALYIPLTTFQGLKPIVAAGAQNGGLISSFDQYNNPLTGGGAPWSVEMTGPGIWGSAHPTIVDLKDGTYAVTAIRTLIGNYRMNITCRGIKAKDHAHAWVVAPAALSAPHSFPVGSMRGIAGEMSMFTIQGCDRYGNNRSSGDAEKISLELAPDKGAGTAGAYGGSGQVLDNKDGTYQGQYFSLLSGFFQVKLVYNGELFMNAPYRVAVVANVIQASECIGFGKNKQKAVSGQLGTFTIQSRDGFKNNITHGGHVFSVVFTGNGYVWAAVEDVGDGTYQVNFRSNTTGNYMVSVMLDRTDGNEDYVPIDESPWKQCILPGAVFPPLSVAFGDGLVGAYVGQSSSFDLQLRDKWSNDVTVGGITVLANVVGPQHKKNKFRRSGDCLDNGDGSYKIDYLATQKGYYDITVMASGVEVKGSPFKVWVSDAVASTADSAPPKLEMIAGMTPQEMIPWTAFSPCPNDCNGRGACVRGQCECYAGYEGEDCSFSPHQCPMACSGNGRCKGGVCECFYDWAGPACSIKSACPFNCSSHGKCVQGSCICDKGYTGSDCSNSLYMCPSGCSGSGECINGKCACYPGYSGDDCTKEVSVKEFCPQLCSGHGACAPSGICNCDFGFAGAGCATMMAASSKLMQKSSQHVLQLAQVDTKSGCSSSKDCNDNGECMEGKCSCYPGFSGVQCATE